jgi:hypothetical protein
VIANHELVIFRKPFGELPRGALGAGALIRCRLVRCSKNQPVAMGPQPLRALGNTRMVGRVYAVPFFPGGADAGAEVEFPQQMSFRWDRPTGTLCHG